MAQKSFRAGDLVVYGLAAVVGYAVYSRGISGNIGGRSESGGPGVVQGLMLQICSIFKPCADCYADAGLPPDPKTCKPSAISPGLPPGTPTPGLVPTGIDHSGQGKYPCHFVQDNGNGTYSIVYKYADNGYGAFTTYSSRAAAEQAFNAAGYTFC